MAAPRSTSKAAEVVPTEAEPTDGAAVVADPALAAPDSLITADGSAADTEVIEPVALVEPPVAEPASSETVVAVPVVTEPVAEETVPDETVAAETVAADDVWPEPVPSAPAHQVVYVEAPKPFVKKGNRGFGILIAILSTIIFAALYAVAEIVTQLINKAPVDFGFASTLDFYAPAIMFLVAFVIVVLIVNRAGWAAHVLGSLFVGLLVFFGSTGIILLIHSSQIPSNRIGVTYSEVLFSVGAIIAALLAREVSLWMGFAIAARGRRVKARNVEARVLYDQEIAAKRAEYERANAANISAASSEPVEPVETVAP